MSSSSPDSGDAPLPAPPRLPRRRDPPTRRTALTVDAVVAAAIEVLDETGVAELSMRKVGARLGTGAASLYAHVSGKDELLELVFDELVGRVALPEPDTGTWREQLHGILRDFHGVLASHRDVALVGLGRVPMTPNTLAAADGLAAVLLAGGLSTRVTALGIDQLILFVAASAFEDGLMENAGMSPADIDTYYTQVQAFYEQLPSQRFPSLAAVAPDLTGPDGEERLEFGISVMLAGMEAMSASELGQR